jgi:hypothetical protein
MAVCAIPDALVDPGLMSYEEAVPYLQAERDAWIASKSPEVQNEIEGLKLENLSDDLRAGEDFSEAPRFFQRQLATTDRIYAQESYALPQDTTLWRGFRGDFPTEVGATFPDKGFAYTSISQEHATRYAGQDGALIRIMAPKGTPTVLGRHTGEAEVVLKRDVVFEILSFDPDTGIVTVGIQ